jgi:hypothetical protein
MSMLLRWEEGMILSVCKAENMKRHCTSEIFPLIETYRSRLLISGKSMESKEFEAREFGGIGFNDTEGLSQLDTSVPEVYFDSTVNNHI